MSQLSSLTTSPYSWAAERAKEALQISQAVQSGQMSKSEAAELLQDLINTDALNKEATDMTTRAELIAAITQLSSFLSLLKI